MEPGTVHFFALQNRHLIFSFLRYKRFAGTNAGTVRTRGEAMRWAYKHNALRCVALTD
jgi:hypothetical protein